MKSLIIKHTELTEMDNKIIEMITHKAIIENMDASKLASIIKYRSISKWLTVDLLNNFKATTILEIYKYAYEENIISINALECLVQDLPDRNIAYSIEQERFHENMLEIFYSVLEKWLQVLIHEEFYKLSMFVYN